MFCVLWLPGMVQILNNLTSFFPRLLKVTFAFSHIWIADFSHSEAHGSALPSEHLERQKAKHRLRYVGHNVNSRSCKDDGAVQEG